MGVIRVHCGRCGVTYDTDQRLDPMHRSCRCEFCGGVAIAEPENDRRPPRASRIRHPLAGVWRPGHTRAGR